MKETALYPSLQSGTLFLHNSMTEILIKLVRRKMIEIQFKYPKLLTL